MPPPAIRNPLTGRKRRLMRHFTSRKRREQYPSLTVNELGDLRDCEAFGNGCECCIRMGALLTIACYARHHQHNPNLV